MYTSVMTYLELEKTSLELKHKALLFETGMERFETGSLKEYKSHVLVISGIRRCGKSTFLHQYVKRLGRDFFYLNFDDLRLSEFTPDDYPLLDALIQKTDCSLLFFDEIQSAPKWELYIRQKLDEQYQVVVTGSNASLLGRELGTKLTGRHITKELFPFSYREFCRFKDIEEGEKSFVLYSKTGGFPEYVKTENPDILPSLINDILYRDIAARYSVRDVASLKNLFVFLLSNCGNLISPSRLTQILGVKSPSTVLDYLSYFETSYMLSLVPFFSWSQKSQQLHPKKVYAVDTSLIHAASRSYTKDEGHLLENIVFTELRRLSADIHYFSDKDSCECDFVVNAKGENPGLPHPLLIQVCTELNIENRKREVNGLLRAVHFFTADDSSKGSVPFESPIFKPFSVILTLNTEDTIITEGFEIRVLPVWKFFGSSTFFPAQ